MTRKTAASSRLKFWGAALVITLALAYPTYTTWTAVWAAQRTSIEAVHDEERLRKERDKWAELDAKHQELRLEVGEQRQAVVAAMKSFGRDELHDALRRAMKAANPSHGIVLPMSGGLWGNTAWIWMPEKGHSLNVQIETTNLATKDIGENLGNGLGKDAEVERDMKIELEPGELHLVEFELKERRKPKDCLMCLRFDGRTLVEQQLMLDPYNSSSHGSGSGEYFVRPRVTQGSSVWNDSPQDIFERRIWQSVAGEKYRLRPLEETDKRSIEIVCKIGIASDGPTYVPKSLRFALERKGIETQEVRDPDSNFYEMLEIIGVKPEEKKSSDEPAP